jgi:hypothetical protein
MRPWLAGIEITNRIEINCDAADDQQCFDRSKRRE